MRAKSLLPVLVFSFATACSCGGGGSEDGGALLTPDGGGYCGDSKIEAPEQCDDGNRNAGDGCSDLCITEAAASCAPESIIDLSASQNGVFFAYQGTTTNKRSELEPPVNCQDDMGGKGAEVVHRLNLPVKSDLLFSTSNAATKLDTVLYQINACTPGPAPEGSSCNDDVAFAASNFKSQIFTPSVEAGERFIVVDSYDLASSALGAYELNGRVRPIVEQGGACDPESLANRCADGLVCAAGPKTCAAGSRPVVTTLEYFNLGNSVVRIVMKGTDAEGDVTDFLVQFLDNVGQPIGGRIALAFDASVRGQTTYAAGGTFDFKQTQLSLPPNSIRVGVRDASNFESTEAVAALQALPERAATVACDLKKLSDQCVAGTFCQETTPGGGAATCVTGAAPAITGMPKAFAAPDGSRRITVEGTDTDGDITNLVLTFKNAQGGTVALDTNGDNSPEQSPVLVFGETNGTTTFSGRSDLPATLFPATTTITQVGVKLRDVAGLESPELTVPIIALPSVANGGGCDTRRWDNFCLDGTLVCEAATNTCSTRSASVTAVCNAAPTLTVGTPVTGNLTLGANRWAPPTGCTEEGGGRGSEAVFKFETTVASDLRFSTNFPETTVDTLVYLADICAETLPVSGCADDVDFGAGNLTSDGFARNVPPGTHYVIVDSWPQGRPGIGTGAFKLSVTVVPLLNAGEACDPVLRANRCSGTLRCKPNAGYTAWSCQ